MLCCYNFYGGFRGKTGKAMQIASDRKAEKPASVVRPGQNWRYPHQGLRLPGPVPLEYRLHNSCPSGP